MGPKRRRHLLIVRAWRLVVVRGEHAVKSGAADANPAQWLPPAPDALCRYGAEWTATKLRWGLAVDELERERLLDIAAGCGGTEVDFTPAP
ncbi:hypothetical protein [Streptomyces sp. NPDC059389]|uniref:hypothetical protein n=1 Tax=Streptomyces sp. NPDC059389 TaxID=3346818 RepID=UPI0036B216B3